MKDKKPKLKQRISRQIGLLMCGALVLVLSLFVGLIWFSAGPRLNIYSIYALILYTIFAAGALLITVHFVVKKFIKQ